MTELIWYAAYGSNLSRSRFERYLRGGAPHGGSYAYPGCRDPSDPGEDRPWEIARELVFGGSSQTWGGGVAFLAQDAGAATKARLYLLSVQQFEDVVAQENWLECGAVKLNAPLAEEIDIGGGHTYGLVWQLGELESRPVLTITQHRGTQPAKPSASYLRHIADGLKDAHEMSAGDIVEYLLPKRGVAGTFTPDELRAVIDDG